MQVPAAHRRLIRRRLLAQCSTPSPPREMKKKKPKSSPPRKAPPRAAPANSASPPAKSNPSKIDGEDKLLPAAVEVSDAQFGPVNAIAQLPLCQSDLVSQEETPPLSPKIVIAEESADPSSSHDEEHVKISAGSLEIPTLSSPVTSQTEAVTSDGAASAEGLLCEAGAADANVPHLSSQTATDVLPSPTSVAKPTPVENVSKVVDKTPIVEVVSEDGAVSQAPTEGYLSTDVSPDPKGPLPAPKLSPPTPAPVTDTWCDRAKGKLLSRKGEAFTLPSGEACVKIPNSVIEKNRKSWEPFVLGQFYSDPPTQGTLHNIVNGIWSNQYRDIAVSKMEGFAFLFRIPNAATRARVIKQKLWQIEGQTMFVDKWEPGVVPTKPELTSAPIWLELRKVPLQFFNEDGLERIAGLVGQPRFLHPTTANKTNLEVAKVFTIIDPRKPLPEAVNVQFDSGEISRVLVSSPWMPPVCELCKEIGHIAKRCPTAPKACSLCGSLSHVRAKCTQKPKDGARGKQVSSDAQGRKTRRGRSKDKQHWVQINNPPGGTATVVDVQTGGNTTTETPLLPPVGNKAEPPATGKSFTEVAYQSKLGTVEDLVAGETSGAANHSPQAITRRNSGLSRSSQSDVQPDSSDVESSDSELEEGEFSSLEPDFEVVRNKKRLSEISSLVSVQGLDSKPWMLVGDFNQIREPAEHSKPRSLNLDKRMRDFNQCLLEANLEDLNFRGSSFTWWNKQKSSPIAKKLDRCLVNDAWYFTFPSAVVFFGSPDFSDHAVAAISLEPDRARVKKPFRFYNFLTKNPQFLVMVCENWFSFNVIGSAMFRVSKKLKMLKKHIKDFSRLTYSGIERKTEEAHDKLLQVQASLMNSPTSALASEELKALKEWEVLAKAETEFFFQRSRVNWLEFGDGSSRLFHRYAATRQAINHIHFLTSDDGQRIDSQSGIVQSCVDYFSDLLGSASPPPMFVQSDLDLLFNFRCSQDQIQGFEKMFTAEDIKNAFFSMPRNKTGGPDGYSVEFYIATWDLIGPEITEAILEFFSSGSLLKQWNTASLVLIPKIPNASHPSEFRPISCLNTVYKVISKLLASRLKEILPLMVSKAQSAFLPGRLLAENVLLATDLVNGYNTQNVSPRGMLKVDLRKAFDCIRWDFILGSLRALAVPESFIRLISECLSTASFSIAINGALGGFFNSSRGIRQGDPLSPYLFVLGMECLSRLLASRYDSGDIGYHPRTEPVKISHLMFADDVMVFFDGTSNSLHGIAECLDDFASWSGLTMNAAKTEIYTAGLDHHETSAVAAYGFTKGTFPVRYLGLPLITRKLKISEYAPLIARLTKCFNAWSVKLLSFAGRLQLLKTVIFGIISFWVSAFILPKGCIKNIESLCIRFLWSGNIERKGIAKVSWATVCLPKDEGGLGLRSISVWNQVLCLKFIWILLTSSSSLWADWHHSVHIQSQSFWSIEPLQTDSWAWKRLLKLRPLATQFCKGVLGNGQALSFWYDVWTPLGQLITHIGSQGPRALRLRKDAVIADAINEDVWYLPHPRSQKEYLGGYQASPGDTTMA
ncbi:Uncharacterized protein Rs2_05224 [Raphanus sativus]|nr:Uncharacterized protein Rs2_05224 [Raphanus sativus]